MPLRACAKRTGGANQDAMSEADVAQSYCAMADEAFDEVGD